MPKVMIVGKNLYLPPIRSDKSQNSVGVLHLAIILPALHGQRIIVSMYGMYDALTYHKYPFVIIEVETKTAFLIVRTKFSLDEIEDFLWRPNSDNIISVGRDERLVHAPISSAIKTDQFASLFSLHVTSKGSVHISMPNIDNEYVVSLYKERHIPLSSSSLKQFYTQETLATFVKWDKMVQGKSLLGIYSNPSHDNSVRLFHQFARKWILGNDEKSSAALAYVCDVNSAVAEELNRPDLKTTWQMIKLLFADRDESIYSSKNSRSLTQEQRTSESFSGYRRRHHRHHHTGRKLTSLEKQQQDGRLTNDPNNEKRATAQEQGAISKSKLGKNDRWYLLLRIQIYFDRFD